MSTPKASDTGAMLTFDEHDNVVIDTSKSTHLRDALRRDYKKCNNCKRWFLLDSFPKSNSKLSKDGHSSFCKECTEKKKSESKPKKPKAERTIPKDANPAEHVPLKTAASPNISDTDEEAITEQTLKGELSIASLLPDDIIIQELRKRGFTGKLTLTKQFEL